MTSKLFLEIFKDPGLDDLRKMLNKYSEKSVKEFLDFALDYLYLELPLKDFNGKQICIMDTVIGQEKDYGKNLMNYQGNSEEKITDEIYSTLKIENINTDKNSVRKIIHGETPTDDSLKKAYGIKCGLDYISDKNNVINTENLRHLYEISVNRYLSSEYSLKNNELYRNAPVYIVGEKLIHTGINHKKLEKYMNDLIEFINSDFLLNDLYIASVIHFYIAYLHPYFDGNGRLARLLSQWYLIQKGYTSVLATSFSSLINESKSAYYKSFKLIENNEIISGIVDVTGFVKYINKYVYGKLKYSENSYESIEEKGIITPKEKELWIFVKDNYGYKEFSTKQLQKDYGKAAYATIRSFVIKFSNEGLMVKENYSVRPRYKIKDGL